MKNVLIINQSAELYGADKVVLELIENFPEGYIPIVVLHEEGPLKKILESQNIQVIKSSVIKVKRGIIKPLYLLQLPFEILKSFIKIKKELKGKKIDLIHSNATSVFIGAFYAFFFRIPHLWHVHEIIEKPRRVALIYPRIIYFFSDKVIFNSKATETHFTTIFPKISTKGIVIYNGLKRKKNFLNKKERNEFRKKYYDCDVSKIIITIIGRISEIKGQKTIVSALPILLKEFPNIHLAIIGSHVSGKDSYFKELMELIGCLNISKHISFLDFQEDIWFFYDASDIVVMPSTEPESFGLVAAEALLSKKNVIASKIGALPEIVIDKQTGLLFRCEDYEDLAEKVSFIINNESVNFGENGHIHVTTNFGTQKFCSSILKVYSELVN